ncbi:MAG: DUF4118 domain-containing protein, partial [Gaiellales bacterium]
MAANRFLHRWSRRTGLAVLLAVVGLVGITYGSTNVSNLSDRPGAALLAEVVLVIGVTMLAGQWSGFAIAAGALLASDWYLARPVHSFTIATTDNRLLFVGFAVAAAVTAALVARLAVA